jgi:hypothetical protein
MERNKTIDFKRCVTLEVNSKVSVETFFENPDKQVILEKVDKRINKLLDKKDWTGEDTGKILFYDYLRVINEDSKNDLYIQQRDQISKRLEKFCDNSYLPESDAGIYKRYLRLFDWLLTAYHKGFIFFQHLTSNRTRLMDIIDGAISAESVIKEMNQSLSISALSHLKNLTLENRIDEDHSQKLPVIKKCIHGLKEAIDGIAFNKTTLSIVGGYADIEELEYFSFEGRLLKLIDGLLLKVSSLNNLINSSDYYARTEKAQKSKVIKSILLNELQRKNLMPRKRNLVNGTCHDEIYKNGFDIAISIAYEKNRIR